jgi:hypothetical protein
MTDLDKTENKRKLVQQLIDNREKELKKLYRIQRKLVSSSLQPFSKSETDLIDTLLDYDKKDDK